MKSKNRSNQQSRASILRWLFITRLIGVGVWTLCVHFPFLDKKQKNQQIRNWSNSLLKILDVQLEVRGVQNIPSTPYLLVSNHISWLDIHLLNAHSPVSFVAKSEVANWPIFGWMAKQLGTLFIRRGDSKHAREVVGQMADALDKQSICIFPEGTSTAGDKVLIFKPNLFEAAIKANVPVYPLAIEYFCKETGTKSAAPAFVGDMGLLDSIANILKSRGLKATLTYLPPIGPFHASSIDRKWLAQHCYDSISNKIIQGK